jgi:hypothetical protein
VQIVAGKACPDASAAAIMPSVDLVVPDGDPRVGEASRV